VATCTITETFPAKELALQWPCQAVFQECLGKSEDCKV
jgi:hypothetical protein